MANASEEQISAVMRIIVKLCARQRAMFDLLRGLQVTQQQMDEAIAGAERQLQQAPLVARLASGAPLDLLALATLLESIQD
jgi:hypothetical protein